MTQHTQIVQRMDVARNRLRYRSHPGAPQRIFRHQARRIRPGLVEVFNYRQRLRDNRAVVIDQRRHQALRVHRNIGLCRLLFAA